MELSSQSIARVGSREFVAGRLGVSVASWMEVSRIDSSRYRKPPSSSEKMG